MSCRACQLNDKSVVLLSGMIVLLLVFLPTKGLEPGSERVEVATEHYAYSLSGQRIFDIEILVVVSVVGSEAESA